MVSTLYLQSKYLVIYCLQMQQIWIISTKLLPFIEISKKGDSNSTIEKELQIRHETVWKVVKKFRETGRTSNRSGQGRKTTVRTKRMIKNTREKLRTNPRRLATKLATETGISQTSMRRILKEDLKTFPYKMQKCHELTPTHE